MKRRQGAPTQGSGQQARPSQAQKEKRSTNSPHAAAGSPLFLPNGRVAVQKRGKYMRKSKIASLLLGASVLAISLPAWAQNTDQGTEAVTVTGSRVARQGFEAPTPTTAIGSVELEQKAALTVTDIIAEIPSLAPNQNNNNSQNIGLSTFNLRNIGPTRTLVLIDGMRVEDTSPTGGFNTNVIPAQLISTINI